MEKLVLKKMISEKCKIAYIQYCYQRFDIGIFYVQLRMRRDQLITSIVTNSQLVVSGSVDMCNKGFSTVRKEILNIIYSRHGRKRSVTANDQTTNRKKE
ncbi:hypothetical protein T4E_4422 [Trichinella pseudospiralis]|uniref:Uncharacterized protein n=1 Tax=Trichinella pseudospiralis TaxID=6337 RepID=A0A0V0YKD1_TRIPS|nr:hypothetical protein T4E_4422 [Trichinella pseudospiralis]